jgi:hypothetical protein
VLARSSIAAPVADIVGADVSERRTVTISDKNRKWFEGIGLDKIKLEITVGNQYFIPIDATAQAEAREWVTEQEKKIRDAEADRIGREKKMLRYTFGTLIAAVVAAIAAIAVPILLPLFHWQ